VDFAKDGGPDAGPRKEAETETSMKRLLAATALALMSAMTAVAPTALAHGDYDRGRWDESWYAHHDWNRTGHAVKCNGTLTGVTISDDVYVPRDGACTLSGSTVKGDVVVRKNAYFQATRTSIRGGVEANEAQTLFIDGGSKVGDDVETNRTAQVYLFESTIGGRIGVYRTRATINVCGNVVKGAGIGIARSGEDVLVGDPLRAGCGGNRVTSGSVLLWKNDTDVEFVVRGNWIRRGSLHVLGNSGPARKFVQKNRGGRTIRCTGNSAPFVGPPNFGWDKAQGQCTG
jgi:hypothetical protein